MRRRHAQVLLGESVNSNTKKLFSVSLAITRGRRAGWMRCLFKHILVDVRVTACACKSKKVCGCV